MVAFADALLEASIPEAHKHASTSMAVDWTDHAAWARPAGREAMSADPDATWGHRNTNTPGTKDGLFFGYYGQAVTIVAEESGPAVPELIRRAVLHPCNIDPPTALVAVLKRMHHAGLAIGDVLADSGYAHRLADRWANPLRGIGARLVEDLHPHDRGTKGTHQGAIACNGALYCPATPPALLDIRPASPGATTDELAAHDARTSELARYKLGRLTADDTDGYHRVGCPASAGKLRCPLKANSMSLDFDRPEVIDPPAGTAPCCTQASITVPPSVNAKTRQKHDYPRSRPPIVLRPPHRRGTQLLDAQGPRQHRYPTRLVPPAGPHEEPPSAGLRRRRAQPARPHQLPTAPNRRRAKSRRRQPAAHSQTSTDRSRRITLRGEQPGATQPGIETTHTGASHCGHSHTKPPVCHTLMPQSRQHRTPRPPLR